MRRTYSENPREQKQMFLFTLAMVDKSCLFDSLLVRSCDVIINNNKIFI